MRVPAQVKPFRPLPFETSFAAARVVLSTRRMNRDEALALLREYTESESLRKHALAVEAAMRHYAVRFGGNVETWGITGLIHDFDYERWPEPPDHTRQGARILRERGVDEEIVGAMLAHAEWNWDEYPPDRPLRKSLVAVDELCGFITAVAYVRPERLAGMAASSVLKKLKQKSFAAAVKREDIERGAQLLGLPLAEHIQGVIGAMQGIAQELGLAPGAIKGPSAQ
jgi:putative nucleotidyltransferase with HDIG domain